MKLRVHPHIYFIIHYIPLQSIYAYLLGTYHGPGTHFSITINVVYYSNHMPQYQSTLEQRKTFTYNKVEPSGHCGLPVPNVCSSCYNPRLSHLLWKFRRNNEADMGLLKSIKGRKRRKTNERYLPASPLEWSPCLFWKPNSIR